MLLLFVVEGVCGNIHADWLAFVTVMAVCVILVQVAE